MKIAGVRAVSYTYQLTRKIGDVHLRDGTEVGSDVAVFVDTDEGVSGVAVGIGIAPSSVIGLAPLLEGADPRSVRGLWEQMVATTFKAGIGGSPKLAIAALDCALWDLKAKIAGVPLWKELGALDGRVRAYASGLDAPLDDDELAVYYTRMAGHGFHAGKLKVGLGDEADLRRLAIMSDALATSGKSPVLIVDSNEYWTPKQSIRRIRRFERDFDLLWAEEPAGRRDAVGLRQVSEGITAAVATGENLDQAEDFANLIRGRAVDIVQIGYGVGGITGALRVAELAYANNLPVAMMNAPGRHMAHLAAALPHHLMMEVLDSGRDQAFRHEARLEDGTIVLGDAPGSGIVFEEENLGRFRTDSPASGALRGVYRRADGTWIDE